VTTQRVQLTKWCAR